MLDLGGDGHVGRSRWQVIDRNVSQRSYSPCASVSLFARSVRACVFEMTGEMLVGRIDVWNGE